MDEWTRYVWLAGIGACLILITLIPENPVPYEAPIQQSAAPQTRTPLHPQPQLPIEPQENEPPDTPVTSSVPADPVQPIPIPRVSRLDISEGDAHVCEKPDDAHYANWHIYAHPKFLFDTRNQDGEINWANGFKGMVPVCFLIDGQGGMRNITFIQSPGEELEAKIKEVLGGWRYQGGMWENQPVDTEIVEIFSFR